MQTYVLVHGAWHSGDLLEPTAMPIREAGHTVHLPTLAGNRPGDSKKVGLDDAIESLISFLNDNNIDDAVLVGHSYGGMVITGAADRLGEGRVRRLVYWNAFVPNPGESQYDLMPPPVLPLFDQLVQPDGSLMLPFPVWRDGFISEADLPAAKAAYEKLNPHPHKTFTDPIRLSRPPAALPVGKSVLLCTTDHGVEWHPRLSEKLGLFRLVETAGCHEMCFTNPDLLGRKIIEAGRD